MEVATTTRNDRRRARTREALIEAAVRVMATKGVDATSLRDITTAADLGLGTFYNHFKSKDDLVDVIANRTVERLGQALDRLTANMDDPAEVFAISFRHSLRSVDRDPVWGWFVVRVQRAEEVLTKHLGHRALRDVRRGVRHGRFRSVHLRPFGIAIQGILVGAMRAKLENHAGTRDDHELTAYTLELLGIEADEARAIARRPLPAVPLVAVD
ncbi:MAG: helix-turn-helix domain containing protein [Myxococcales bacterium]|nr:helix-turn-helix domain containing protein [Myxococcales bacterium]